MSETELHRLLCWGVIATAAVVLALLLVITAPYGRHGRAGWGPTMPTRWSWVLMEAPAVIVFAAVYLTGERRFEAVPLVLLALWQLHYINRTFVFPFRIDTQGKRTAILIAAMAIVFNTVNAYINARHISQLGDYPLSWLGDPRFIAGVLLFLAGRQLNLHSDAILMRLRKGADSSGSRYVIPHGGAYRWVSSPNYLGEIIEWAGFALACWSLAGVSFALFTFANLAPRALANHRWYREKFANYPPERRALIPYLL